MSLTNSANMNIGDNIGESGANIGDSGANIGDSGANIAILAQGQDHYYM